VVELVIQAVELEEALELESELAQVVLEGLELLLSRRTKSLRGSKKLRFSYNKSKGKYTE
jgi:hypothetical protein